MLPKTLTVEQAFLAAYAFIHAFYIRDLKPENLTILLDGMLLDGEHKTSDPAYWYDWEEAVKKALNNPDLANHANHILK